MDAKGRKLGNKDKRIALRNEASLKRTLSDFPGPYKNPAEFKKFGHLSPEELEEARHYRVNPDSPAGLRHTRAVAKTLQQARDQLNKETERGEHRPAIGGFTDHKHGGES